MKVLLFSGDHPRHLFVHAALLKAFDVCGVVSLHREEILPAPPAGILAHDAENFRRHFADRLASEQKYFGDMNAEAVFKGAPVCRCDSSSLNSLETAAFVRACAPDVVFIFGTELIKEPVLSELPRDRVNLHFGLSPWYRGSATLFWPFYNLEPQWAGSTLHQIVPHADAGAIIHQTVPKLQWGDGIHDVACKTVIASREDLVAVLKRREERGHFEERAQQATGRLYLRNAFRPEHLRVIYDLFNNDMVDAYLRGDLTSSEPPLISGLSSVSGGRRTQ